MKLDASFFEVAFSAIDVSAKRVTSRSSCTQSQQPSLLGPPSPIAKVWLAAIQDRSINIGSVHYPKETRAGS